MAYDEREKSCENAQVWAVCEDNCTWLRWRCIIKKLLSPQIAFAVNLFLLHFAPQEFSKYARSSPNWPFTPSASTRGSHTMFPPKSGGFLFKLGSLLYLDFWIKTHTKLSGLCYAVLFGVTKHGKWIFGGAIKIYRFLSDTICGRFAWENAHCAQELVIFKSQSVTQINIKDLHVEPLVKTRLDKGGWHF